MSDQATGDERVTEGTWALPLLIIIPLVAIRYFSSMSTPWLVIAWALWGLAALLAVVGWVSVVRHGVGDTKSWFTCALLHVALASQVVALLR
ncbi:hypothetical protein [Streptomyces hesseae]|uniref:Integral membrane protein n=1 Tax=Streptomyces hesseae TaxID=3075519 RepID=A0ABU2SYF9_9ACTN|nr:hypothetical protein [Streptomyces sp. DSM 40473]MDT0454011.1 hypothetical protein [Streptomyces sp. DSM 40473]